MLGMDISPAEASALQDLARLLALANAKKQSGFYTDFDPDSGSWTLRGLLVWRPRGEVTTIEDDEGRRHEFYDDHLAGRPVPDTLQEAVSAVMAI
jgi:hypothetical protein